LIEKLSLILQQMTVVAVIAIGQKLIVPAGRINSSCGMVIAFGSIVMTKFAVTMGIRPCSLLCAAWVRAHCSDY
jgi:fructose transport system permease protein